MHLVIPTHFSLFWVVCHPSKTFSPKEFERKPQDRLFPSPHRQTIPSLTSDPWPTNLVLAGYKLVVPKPCACSTPMYVHGLFVVHAFAMTWRLAYTFYCSFLISLWHEWVFELSFFMSYFLLELGLAWLWAFPSPFHTLFAMELTLLPCHSVIPAMLLFDSCLLGLFWACCMFSLRLIPVAQYYHWARIQVVLGFLVQFHRFWASLAHFILLGILNPFHFLGHPRPIPILHSHELFLSLLGFSDPNCHILYFWGLWAFPPTPYLIHYFGLLWPILACFLFLIMPMGLLLFSLGFFGPACFLRGPFAVS